MLDPGDVGPAVADLKIDALTKGSGLEKAPAACAQQTANVGQTTALDARKGYFELVRQYIDGLPADRYPNLQAAAPRIFTASLDERFVFGIGCLIGGFEARLLAHTAAAGQGGAAAQGG